MPGLKEKCDFFQNLQTRVLDQFKPWAARVDRIRRSNQCVDPYL